MQIKAIANMAESSGIKLYDTDMLLLRPSCLVPLETTQPYLSNNLLYIFFKCYQVLQFPFVTK